MLQLRELTDEESTKMIDVKMVTVNRSCFEQLFMDACTLEADQCFKERPLLILRASVIDDRRTSECITKFTNDKAMNVQMLEEDVAAQLDASTEGEPAQEEATPAQLDVLRVQRNVDFKIIGRIDARNIVQGAIESSPMQLEHFSWIPIFGNRHTATREVKEWFQDRRCKEEDMEDESDMEEEEEPEWLKMAENVSYFADLMIPVALLMILVCVIVMMLTADFKCDYSDQ
ncbi:unnamed protein product [Caenorhabditis nigoni]